MTLYWWTHWFWITSLNFPALLFWGTSVQSVPFPFVPIVQNGHQNGPYVSKPVLEHPDKALFDPPKEDCCNKEVASHSTEYSEITDENASQNSFRPIPIANAIQIPDTYLDEISESMSDEYAVPQTTSEAEAQPSSTHVPIKNPSPMSVRHVTGTTKWFAAPDRNDDDDIAPSFSRHYPRMLASHNSTADSVSTLESSAPPPEPAADERPLGDGPASTDGLVSAQPKSNWKQLPAMATTVAAEARMDQDTPATDKPSTSRGRTVNKEKTTEEHVVVTSTTEALERVRYVTPVTASDTGEDAKSQVSEKNRLDAPVRANSSHSSVVENANSSVQLSQDGNASSVGVARSLARSPGTETVSKERVTQAEKQEGLDAASITGIAMGIVTAAGLVGAVSFVLYRRRYLNKPQTLNDSNPDSSGYLDDSTLREHSEEMYSLDNDSFLNSLEAMTIQNYWTDSVKHTKL